MDRDEEIRALKARLVELEGGGSGASSSPMASESRPEQPSNPSLMVTWPWALAGVGVLALVVLSALFSSRPSVPAPPVVAPPSAIQARIQAELKAQEVQGRWDYSTQTDPMTDAKTYFACVRSTNDVQLSPPYSNVRAELCVRQSTRHGLDVIYRLLGDGQILCRSYDGCTARIRFDDGSVQSFSARGPADHSSNMVFIVNASRFVQALKGAERTRVELTYYQAGSQSIEFDTRKLEWPRPT